MEKNKFMCIAVLEAWKALKTKDGGPFGVVIVRNKKIISRGHNKVIKTNDPTAHAEIVAIRKATKKLKRFDLSDCEIYSSCEPCPMCFAAIHWAKIKKLYYGCTQQDAANIGFDDKFIYDAIKGTAKRKQVTTKQVNRQECLEPFKKWKSIKNKTRY
ncbi:MAG: nucleoside deaminase [Patescibacteria group bacterium]|nr:nucleoside deaminase [Patescibacteria group bacterium]MDD5164631.1 nucleoside deaminase [Patescibacteria group bacterium]MDD5534527.1 nucleoside deaminase [Patescibacteria group bacterium]